MLKTFWRYYKKHIIGGFLIVLAVIAVSIPLYLLGLRNYYPAHKMASLEININGQKRAFEGEVVDGMTVLEALQASTLAGNISFSFTIDADNKLIIKSLDGYSSNKSNKQVTFYLNSLKIETEKIQSTIVRAGDAITVISE